MSRRLQIVRIDMELLAEVLKSGASRDDTYTWRCVQGLPTDVEPLGVWLDQEYRQVCFTFSHPSWPEVFEGSIIPNFTPVYQREYTQTEDEPR